MKPKHIWVRQYYQPLSKVRVGWLRCSFCFLIVNMLLLLSGTAQAVVVADLNTVSLPVKNLSSKARRALLPQALGRVFIKMSANPRVTTLPMVQNAQANVINLIQSYSYVNQSDYSGESQLMLQVTFDQNALKNILKKAGQPIWSNDRPLTLFCISIQNGNDTQILTNTDSELPLVQNLNRMVDNRGIPVLFPAMDLQDWSTLNGNDGAQNPIMFGQPLLKVMMKRYGAKVALGGRVYQTVDDRWQGDWIFLIAGAPYHWSHAAASKDLLLKQMVNTIAGLMANQYAVVDKNILQTQVTVTVSHIISLEDYTALLAILRRLTPVTKVVVNDITGSDVILQVKTIGGEQALAQALSAVQYFSLDHSDQQAGLHYRWVSAGTARILGA